MGESAGLGLKCGKLGVSVCKRKSMEERRKAIRWYSLFLCIHLSQVRATDIFSSPDRFDQHSTLSPPLPPPVDPRRFAHLFTVNNCFATFSTSLSFLSEYLQLDEQLDERERATQSLCNRRRRVIGEIT